MKRRFLPRGTNDYNFGLTPPLQVLRISTDVVVLLIVLPNNGGCNMTFGFSQPWLLH